MIECPMRVFLAVCLWALIPGMGHVRIGLSDEFLGWFLSIMFFYFLCLPLGVALHFFSLLCAAAEASQRAWLR